MLGRRYLSFAAILAAILLSGFSTQDKIDNGQSEHNPGIAGQRKMDGLPLIPKLRWEMRREQIQQAYPEVEDLWIMRGIAKAPNYRMLKIPNYLIDGCEFRLELDFFNPPEDTLTGLSGYYVGSNVEDCFQRMQTKFLSEFGRHPLKSTGDTFSNAGKIESTDYFVWLGRVTTISLDVTTTLKSGARRFRFSLQHTGAPGTYVE